MTSPLAGPPRGGPPGRKRACAGHPLQVAVCGCGLCGAGLCDACFEHLIDGSPACARCAYELATRQQRSVSLALTLGGAALGGAGWAAVKGYLAPAFALLAGVGGLILAATVAMLVRSGRGLEVERRDREAPADPAPQRAPAHPYRQRARHVALGLSPKISGAGTALALGASFLMAAAIFPKALSLPGWLEAEIVLAACWVVMTVVLSVLLYRGYRLKDDYLFVSPFRAKPAAPPEHATSPPSPLAPPSPRRASATERALHGCDCSGGCGSIDGEAGLVLVVVVIGALVLGGVGWVVVELALPLVVFAAYTLLLAAMRHVAHDRHGCEGRLSRSVGWGALWSAIFVAPLAIVVAAVHFALAR